MTTLTLDVELYICEIKKYPEVWDFNCESYRHKNRKQAAWCKIANLFIPDFDDMRDSQKMDVLKKLQNKWRNIRDSYVRHLKRKDSSKGYMYASHLSFLNESYIKGSDEEWSDDEKKNIRLQKTSSKDSCSEDDTFVENVKRQKVRKLERENVVALEYVEAPVSVPDHSCDCPLVDEDRSFFNSLLPAIRNFDIDQKLEFRNEVIFLIKKIRRSQNNDALGI